MAGEMMTQVGVGGILAVMVIDRFIQFSNNRNGRNNSSIATKDIQAQILHALKDLVNAQHEVSVQQGKTSLAIEKMTGKIELLSERIPKG